jgi:PEGA domain-containing protein
MAASRPSSAHASVLFLGIPGFARQAVADQARIKSQLEAIVASSVAGLRDDERIVLDSSAGMAVVVLANPAAALQVAWRAQARRELALELGLTHGPVRVSDDGLDPVVHGDGIAAAEAISAFARPGAVAISREFREALDRSAPGIARNLPGNYSSVEAADRAFELVYASEASIASRRRRFLSLAASACVAILALGGVVRWTAPGAAVPPPPGTVTFDIRPTGEIFVNGQRKGNTPPLKSIQLPPGTHELEIRHERFKPLVSALTIAPGEEIAVAHTFAPPKQVASGKGEGERKTPPQGAWRRFVDKLKF